MSLQSLGLVSLSFSTIVYSVWLLPQIGYNARRHSVEGLSFLWHALLVFGACFDAIYGVGTQLPWLYRLVTILTLMALAVQHWQWVVHGCCDRLRLPIMAVTASAIILLVIASCHAYLPFSRGLYDVVGLLSNLSFLLYPLPQIIKQYHERSTAGLSVLFVLVTLVLNISDGFSAIALGWDWPSLLGPPLLILCQLILLMQVYRYRSVLPCEAVA